MDPYHRFALGIDSSALLVILLQVAQMLSDRVPGGGGFWSASEKDGIATLSGLNPNGCALRRCKLDTSELAVTTTTGGGDAFAAG